MNLRTEWTNTDSVSKRFYTAEETVNEVKENFDIRRLYSAEGKYITVNNVTEKCLVQTSSNPLKQLNDERKICCPKTMSVNRGDYVQYEDSHWMIDANVVDVDDAYWFTRIIRCNYILQWQNKFGEIKKKWCVTQNAVQYNNGESGNSTITLGSDQLMILIPYDEETIKIRRGKRFFISNDLEEPMVYKLTRPDSTTYVKDGHGYLCIMVTEDQTNSENDRKDLMLCDYVDIPIKPDNPNQSTILSGKIIYKGSNVITAGGNAKLLSAEITDKSGNILKDPEFTWNTSIIDEFKAFLICEHIGENRFKIRLDYDDLLAGNYIKVFITDSVGNEITSEIFEIGGIL